MNVPRGTKSKVTRGKERKGKEVGKAQVGNPKSASRFLSRKSSVRTEVNSYEERERRPRVKEILSRETILKYVIIVPLDSSSRTHLTCTYSTSLEKERQDSLFANKDIRILR